MSLSPFPRQASLTNLERVVRPFYNRAAKPSRDRVQAEDAATEQPEAHLAFSAQMRGSWQTLDALSLTIKWPTDDQETPDADWKEIDRETHTKRVENPDDPDQYIDVEVVDVIWYRDKHGFLHRIQYHDPYEFGG